MITVEIVKELRELKERLLAYKKDSSKAIICSEYGDVLKKLTDNGRKKWLIIEYRGKMGGLKEELAVLKQNNFVKYFLSISMSNPTLMDVSDIMEEISELDKCNESEWEFDVRRDEALRENELKVVLMVPEYELGWQMHKK